jgi:hypothetical protein
MCMKEAVIIELETSRWQLRYRIMCVLWLESSGNCLRSHLASYINNTIFCFHIQLHCFSQYKSISSLRVIVPLFKHNLHAVTPRKAKF